MLLRRIDGADAFPRFIKEVLDGGAARYNEASCQPAGAVRPAANIVEGASAFRVELAVPGFAKEDFKIDLNEEVLVVTASKEAKEEAKDEKLVRREFSVSAIERRFMLPKDLVDKDAISAKYDNGILTIAIPKKEEVKSAEPRLIAVE